MGLPQLDFRVPEGAWFKSAVARKIAATPWLTSLSSRFGALSTAGPAGTLAWPYKIAVVAVMMLVASGTLVTFGMAGAETPSSTTSTLPGSDEASPTVQGQALPGNSLSPGLFNPDDLMSTLDLHDFSPLDPGSLDDDDEDDNSNDDENDNNSNGSSSNGTNGSNNSSGTNSGSTATPKPTESPDEEEVEGPKHKAWVEAKAAYDDAREDYEDAKAAHDDWEDANDKYQDCRKNALTPKYMGKNCDKDYKPGAEPSVPSEPQDPGSEPDYTS